MKSDEFVIPCIFLIGFLFSLIILINIIRVKNIRNKYLILTKYKRCNWKKIGKWYLWIQLFMLILYSGNKSIILTISMPVILILFIILCYFSSMPTTPINEDEFNEYKKIEERDRKISKIIK